MLVFLSRLLKSIMILFVICGLFVAFLPRILSTEWGRTQMIAWVNRSIPGEIEIQYLDLNWSKGQVLEGLSLKDQEGYSILEVEKISTEGTLWQLLFKKIELGFTQIQKLNAAITTDDEGRTNLQHSLGMYSDQHVSQYSSFNLASPIVLSNVDAELHLLSKNHSLSARMKGLTCQDQLNGSFDIRVILNDFQTIDWDQLKEKAQNYLNVERSKEAEIQARIVNFPVDLIDRFIHFKHPHLNGFFRSIWGDRLNLTINKQSHQEGLAFHLIASTPLMKGDVKGKMMNGKVILQEPALFHFDLTPEFVNPFTHSQCELLKPSRLTLNCFDLSFPLNILESQVSTDPSLLAFQANLTLAKTELETQSIGRMDIPESHLNLKLSINPNNAKEWEAALSLQTPNFKINEIKFFIGKELLLAAPVKVEGTLPADFLQQVLKKEDWKLDQPVSLQFILKHLQIPLEQPQLTKYQLESSIPLLQLSNLSSLGKLHIQDLSLHISGDRFTELNSQLDGQVALLEGDGSPLPWFADPIQFTQKSLWKIGTDHKIEMASGQLQLLNAFTHVHAIGHLTSDFLFELTKPVEIQYLLTPHALQAFGQLFNKTLPKLEKNAQLKLTMDPITIDLEKFSFSSLKMQGKLGIDHLLLQDISKTISTVKEVDLHWMVDAPKNLFSGSMKGIVYNDKNCKPSPLSAEIQFWPNSSSNSQNVTDGETEFRLNCSGFPISLINTLLKSDDLTPLLGPIVDVNVKTFFDPMKKKPGYCDVILDSKLFHLRGRFKLDKLVTIYDLNKLPNIRLTVTPESYEYLKKMLSFQNERQLKAPLNLEGTLTQLSFPLTKSWMDQCMLDLKISSTDIQWQDSPQSAMKFEGQLTTQQLSDNLNCFIKVSSSSPSSAIAFQGTLKNIFDEKGNLHSWPKMSLITTTEGAHLSPFFIQNLLFLNQERTQQLQSLFGDAMDLKISCQIHQLNGPIQASCHGTQGEIQLNGQMKKGILTLNHPFEASFKMVPLMGQQLLSGFPLLSGAVESQHPIKLTISPTEFSCPLFPFQLANITIGQATLDLGKVHFRKEGEVHKILDLIHPITNPHFTIWFTPLYLQLNKGILTFQRLDMLVSDSYTLASWGKMDLNTQQSQFILGISEQTLRYAFGIQGLDEQYMLPIPIRSAKGKLEIDKKKLTGKIATLIAQTQGKKSHLLGDLLDLALSTQEEDSPLPTTQPFPWQKEIADQSSMEKISGEKSISHAEETPEKNMKKHQYPKNLEEGTLHLFNQLLDGFLKP